MSDAEISSSEEVIFDPDQDPEEKRAVRQNYRSLAKKFEHHQGNPNELTADEMIHQVNKANELFAQVKGPQEATLDSHFLLMATNLGAQKARAMKSGSGAFDVEDFVSKLVYYMGGQTTFEDGMSEDSDLDDGHNVGPPLDWDRIGRKVMAKSRRVPVTGYMLGPLSIEQKKRTAAKRSKLEKNKEDERKPQELKEEDISRSQNETTTNVAILEAILNEFDEENPVNLFQFVINPKDFAQSVENIFYLSFLIRDGKAAFETHDGEPVIFPCLPPGDAEYAEGLKKRQMVLEFDMETWKRAIQVFNITESLIPQRPPAKTKLGDKWYG